MMMITTRSSIRVKPPSLVLRLIRLLSLASIEYSSFSRKGRWLSAGIGRSESRAVPHFG
jgi:hypothetical protein